MKHLQIHDSLSSLFISASVSVIVRARMLSLSCYGRISECAGEAVERRVISEAISRLTSAVWNATIGKTSGYLVIR